MSLIIYTCQRESEDLCVNEILRTIQGTRFEKRLGDGVGAIDFDGAFPEFADKVRESGLIFTRHIFPVDCAFEFTDGVPDFYPELSETARRMDRCATFSVQFRSGGGEHRLVEARQAAVEFLTGKGFMYRLSNPEQVISGYLSDDRLYMGYSKTTDNLSGWPGGMRAYALREDTVSRAEFKLLEALERFGSELPAGGSALDLGAAPGGWTKVLLERGMNVTAVDPAELAPAITDNPSVTHFRGLAQEFGESGAQKFDILVNDMRMDIPNSVKITNELSGRLNPGGLMVMTFKMQKSKPTAQIRRGLELLGKRYRILYTAQLFHNRSEITVCGTPLSR